MNHTLDISVSFFKGLKCKTPVEANLLDLLTGAAHEKYKDAVLKVRAESDPDKQKALKNALPMYAISGLYFRTGGVGIYAPSSLIGIDIDEKDNRHITNFDELKKYIGALPFIAYCGYSCRGKGYFCIIPIEAWHAHGEHFDSLQLDFQQLGINIDKNCRDIGRRRFVSYDPEPYINPNAEVYQYVVKPQHVLHQGKAIERTPEEIAELAFITGRLISAIHQKKVDITKGRDNWVRIGLALADEFGEAGRKMFHEVSKYWEHDERQESYEYDIADRTFDELLSNSRHEVHIGTFFHICKQYGLGADIDFDSVNIDITA